MRYPFRMAAALCGGLFAFDACAQPVAGPQITLEGETDHRERGLSWSDGKATVGASADVPLTYDLALGVGALALRDSARHGGAEALVRVAPRYTVRSNGWDFTAGLRGNVFLGRSGTSYGEVTGDVSRTLGPAQLTVGVAYAPPQDAIGGSNLYVDASLSASVPGTPVTLYGGLGHSSGSTRNDPRAARLRPGGDYLDHHFGAEYAKDRLAVGVRYSGTSIGRSELDPLSPWTDRHVGARVMGYVGFTP